MRAILVALALVGGSAVSLSGLRENGFIQREECACAEESQIYKDLLAKHTELLAKYQNECVGKEKVKSEEEGKTEEAKAEEGPTKEEGGITTDPEHADGKASEGDKAIAGDVGETKKENGGPRYEPPASRTGKPDSATGWDYRKDGADWDANFASCAATAQSPVDISRYTDMNAQTMSVLWFDYFVDPKIADKKKTYQVKNSGHGIWFDNDGLEMGKVKLGSNEFKVVDWEVRQPAEHTIDQIRYPLEIQVMHKDSNGKMLGVAILVKEGASNEFLAAVIKSAKKLPKWSLEKAVESADLPNSDTKAFQLEDILRFGDVHPGGDLTFYNYEGSLTQPPCTEGVDWWVLSSPVDASGEEIAAIKEATETQATEKGNARKAQPLNGRKIKVGHTGFSHHGAGAHKMPGKAWPPRANGESTQDHPWKKPEEAHWKEAVKETNWVPDSVDPPPAPGAEKKEGEEKKF